MMMINVQDTSDLPSTIPSLAQSAHQRDRSCENNVLGLTYHKHFDETLGYILIADTELRASI